MSVSETAAVVLTDVAWEELYAPQRNHLDPDASWSVDDGPGCLYETFGDEWAYILRQDLCRVWTLLTADEDGKQVIVNGLHRINRLGYFVTQKPWAEGSNITVTVE